MPGLTVDDVRAVTGAAVHDGAVPTAEDGVKLMGQPRQISTGYTERGYP